MRFLSLTIALALVAAPAVLHAQSSDPSANMREYFLVLLVNPGPERIAMPDDVFQAHRAYMDKNHGNGTYLIGGPITDGSRIRGMMIAQGKDVASVRSIVERDPAVKAGVLAVEVHNAILQDLSSLASK